MAFFSEPKSEFSSLNFEEFVGQWENVSMDQLTADEQAPIEQFHKLAAAPDAEFDASNVLLVQAESGFLKDVYAASLRCQSNDDESLSLVIKLGGNIYPATIEQSETKIGARKVTQYMIACGQLFGQVSFDDKESEADITIDNTKTKVTYTRCWVCLGDGSGSEWKCPLTLDLAKQPSKQQVLASIEQGTLASLLKPASGGSGGGGQARGMVDLGEGVFPVSGIRSVDTKNGERFLLFIDGFGDVWSRGNADKQLSNDEQRSKLEAACSAGTLTLAVGNIQRKPTKDGEKVYLNSALRIKKTEAEQVSEKRELMAQAKAISPATPQRPTLSEADMAEIPF